MQKTHYVGYSFEISSKALICGIGFHALQQTNTDITINIQFKDIERVKLSNIYTNLYYADSKTTKTREI